MNWTIAAVHFYLALYWAEALASQSADTDLKKVNFLQPEPAGK